MSFLPLPDNAARQVIDSEIIWSEFLLAKASAKPYFGGMYWKKEGSYEYLVRTFPGNRRERMGPRSTELELLFQNFHSQKETTKNRLATLSEALDEAQRLNKALRAGRVPDGVVRLLNGFRELGIAERIVVVGTHALFAYESAAGVRIVPDATLARDVNPMGDATRLVTFLVDNDLQPEFLLSALQEVDGSYRVRGEGSANECIVNSKGFGVNFLHSLAESNPVQRSPLANIPGAGGPLVDHANNESLDPVLLTVISSTGKMATMRVLPPAKYVDFCMVTAKRESRALEERSRDLAQAEVIQKMLDAGMLSIASCQGQ
jgi:hypothetical protein